MTTVGDPKMILKPERSSYTVLDFLEWNNSGTLQLSPKFQRRSVWKTPAKSYFIDSILKGMPVPPIYLRVTQNEQMTKTIREIIDGQQRLRSVIEYVEGRYALTSSVCDIAPGKRFEQLEQEQQNNIREYSFICESFSSISDIDVLEVFARLNTHSIQLNDQELRNGKYFGQFKRSAYSLAHEHLEFWTSNKLFTNARIARMLEVELTSELLVLQADGFQDKKKSINKFYSEFDEKFPGRRKNERQFRATINAISDVFEDSLSETEFRRIPLFYSVYSAVYHRLFGLPGIALKTPKRGRLTTTEASSVWDQVAGLSETLSAARAEEPIPNRDQTFVNACLTQTDNIRPREVRFRTIYNRSFR